MAARRRFEDPRNIDPKLVQAYLDDNDGLAPDDWVESAEGGAIDSEIWSKETPEDRALLMRGLDRALANLKPSVLDADGELRYD